MVTAEEALQVLKPDGPHRFQLCFILGYLKASDPKAFVEAFTLAERYAGPVA